MDEQRPSGLIIGRVDSARPIPRNQLKKGRSACKGHGFDPRNLRRTLSGEPRPKKPLAGAAVSGKYRGSVRYGTAKAAPTPSGVILYFTFTSRPSRVAATVAERSWFITPWLLQSLIKYAAAVERRHSGPSGGSATRRLTRSDAQVSASLAHDDRRRPGVHQGQRAASRLSSPRAGWRVKPRRMPSPGPRERTNVTA